MKYNFLRPHFLLNGRALVWAQKSKPHYVLQNQEIHSIFAKIGKYSIFLSLRAEISHISQFCALLCTELRCATLSHDSWLTAERKNLASNYKLHCCTQAEFSSRWFSSLDVSLASNCPQKLTVKRHSFGKIARREGASVALHEAFVVLIFQAYNALKWEANTLKWEANTLKWEANTLKWEANTLKLEQLPPDCSYNLR